MNKLLKITIGGFLIISGIYYLLDSIRKGNALMIFSIMFIIFSVIVLSFITMGAYQKQNG